jgi:hypothetical protein
LGDLCDPFRKISKNLSLPCFVGRRDHHLSVHAASENLGIVLGVSGASGCSRGNQPLFAPGTRVDTSRSNYAMGRGRNNGKKSKNQIRSKATPNTDLAPTQPKLPHLSRLLVSAIQETLQKLDDMHDTMRGFAKTLTKIETTLRVTVVTAAIL